MVVTLVGLEPTILGTRGRHLNHKATAPLDIEDIQFSFGAIVE